MDRTIWPAALIFLMGASPTAATQEGENQAEARRKSIKASIVKAAALARRRDTPALLKGAGSRVNPYQRVICGYALWRLDSAQYTETFLDSFRPNSKAPLWLTELEAFSYEHPAPKFPGDTTSFSYWSVSKALLSLARKGNDRALGTWLTFAGGDGEYGEGKSEDLTTFFLENPLVVVRNWALIRKHKDQLWHWGYPPSTIQQAQSQYSKILLRNDPRRSEIMAVLDQLLSLSREESQAVDDSK